MTNEKESQAVIGYMESLTIEITLSTEGGYMYKVWPKSVDEIGDADGEYDEEGDDNGGLCTGNMGDAIGMATESALAVVRAHFSDNVWNNDICSSSLDENGEPATDGETAHKWSEPYKNHAGETVRECNECGAVDEYDGTFSA